MKCFFQPETNTFPLIQCMLPYYNENDSMNRTNVRNSILLILSKENAHIESYFTKLPAVSYFANVAFRLVKLTENLRTRVNSASKEIKATVEEIINEAGQINEILCLQRKKVNFILLNALFQYYINPCLLGSIVVAADEGGDERSAFALFAMNLLLKALNEEVFMNVLFTLLFCKVTVFNKRDFTAQPNEPFCFQYKCDSQYQKGTFDNFILHNYSNGFIASLIADEHVLIQHLDFIEIKKLKKYLTHKNKEYENEKAQNKKELLYKCVEEFVQKKLLKNTKQEIEKEHLALSEAIGNNVGLVDEKENKKLQTNSFMGKMLMLYNGLLNQNEFHSNFIRKGMHELLMETRREVDETTARHVVLNKLFTCALIYNCINRNVSEFIMKMCLMFNFNKVNLNKECKQSNIEPTNDIKSEYEAYMFNNSYFSNATLKQRYTQFSHGIITFILNILSVEHLNNILYPTIIYDIAVIILHHLIGDPADDMSDSSINIHNINKAFISNIYVNVVPARYRQTLAFLKDKNSTKPLGFVEFHKEWKQYNRYLNSNNDIKTLIEFPEKYLLPYLTSNYDYSSCTNSMKFKNYLHLFMVYHDLLAKRTGSEMIVNAFPLFAVEKSLVNNKIKSDSEEFNTLRYKEGMLVINGKMYIKGLIKEKNGWVFIMKNMMYIGTSESSSNPVYVFKEMFLLHEISLEKDEVDLQLKIISEKEVKYVMKYQEKDELDKDYEQIIKRRRTEEVNSRNEFENYIQMVYEKDIKLNNNS